MPKPLVSDHHGGFDATYFRSIGRDYDPQLDFSVNINPWGPSDALMRQVREVDYRAYPDPKNLLVREAIAQELGLLAAHVVVDAGSCRILWTIVQTLLRPNDAALVVEPTFGEFHRAVQSRGATLHAFRRTEASGWNLDLDALSARIQETKARLVYLCDPNNPTGEVLDFDFVPTLAERHPECIILWDEAYRFLTHVPDQRTAAAPANVIRLQSLTKEQGVPGLRIGYAVMDGRLAKQLEQHRPAWCCGNAEEVGILAALHGRAALPERLALWFHERERMVLAAQKAGFSVHVADVPWFLLHGVDAAEMRDRALRDEGLLMRDCSSFGIPDALRVCPRLPEANTRWIRWISKQSAAL